MNRISISKLVAFGMIPLCLCGFGYAQTPSIQEIAKSLSRLNQRDINTPHEFRDVILSMVWDSEGRLLSETSVESEGNRSSGFSSYVTRIFDDPSSKKELYSETFVIGNPKYYADLEKRESQFFLSQVSPRKGRNIDQLNAAGFPLYFHVPICFIFLKSEENSNFQQTPDGLELKIDGGSQELTWGRSRILKAYLKLNRIENVWLPHEVDLQFEMPNPDRCERKRSVFEWEESDNRHYLKSQVMEATYLETEHRRIKEVKKFSKEFRPSTVTLNQSECYLSYFGLPEPEFITKKPWPIGVWIGLLSVTTFAAFFLYKFCRR